MTTTRTAIAVTTAALLALTACGSDDGDGPAASSDGGTEEALRQAVQRSVNAINEGDVDALLASQSAHCREQMTEAEATQGLELIDTLYGDVQLESLDILEFDGTTARVRGTTGIQAIDEGGDQDGGRWIWEDGAWRDDSCDEDSGSGEATTEEALPELSVGGTYTWPEDQASATVDSVTEFTEFGEYESPEPGEIAFRVEITVTNDGDNPLSMDEFSTLVEGATNGGEAASTSFEADSNEFAGQLASGVTATFTADYVLEEQYGRDILITVQRWDQDLMADSPQWMATIQ